VGSECRFKETIATVIADPEPSFRRICRESLERIGAPAGAVRDPQTEADLIAALESEPKALVLVDPALLTASGQSVKPANLIRRLRKTGHSGPVVICTNDASASTATAFLKAGAADVMTKPVRAEAIAERLLPLIPRAKMEPLEPATILAPCPLSDTPKTHFAGFIGQSAQMQSVYAQIEAIAGSNAPAFITGESGTGKELCADAIHRLSTRRKRSPTSLNCSAIPHDLMESEIFGHVKGAFTGAISDRPGAAELADGGTLFLDEICEMDITLQAKLLRFIQTGSVRRVGGTQDIQVDIRFVCATNRDPLAEVQAGRFREDLFYRLHVIPIHLLPLRERAEDILPIARNFLTRCTEEERSDFIGFSDDAATAMTGYDWPGNVRQLQNVIRRIVVLNQGDTITADMFHRVLNENQQSSSFETPPGSDGQTGHILPYAVQERQIIEDAVRHCSGNIVEAARALAISPSTIYRKMQAWHRDVALEERYTAKSLDQKPPTSARTYRAQPSA